MIFNYEIKYNEICTVIPALIKCLLEYIWIEGDIILKMIKHG